MKLYAWVQQSAAPAPDAVEKVLHAVGVVTLSAEAVRMRVARSRVVSEVKRSMVGVWSCILRCLRVMSVMLLLLMWGCKVSEGRRGGVLIDSKWQHLRRTKDEEREKRHDIRYLLYHEGDRRVCVPTS